MTGQGTGTVTFTVPLDAPLQLFYQCSLHPFSMYGTLWTDTPPPPPPVGACCASSCTLLNETMCALEGGMYLGLGTQCGVDLCPFADEMPVPPVAVPETGSVEDGSAVFRLSVRQFSAALHRDLPATTLWCTAAPALTQTPNRDHNMHLVMGAASRRGYNGVYPGPTIVAVTNQPITVIWENELRSDNGANAQSLARSRINADVVGRKLPDNARAAARRVPHGPGHVGLAAAPDHARARRAHVRPVRRPPLRDAETGRALVQHVPGGEGALSGRGAPSPDGIGGDGCRTSSDRPRCGTTTTPWALPGSTCCWARRALT